MKLNEIYKSMLSLGGLVPTSDGFVNMNLGGEPQPAIVGGKRLVLPTPEHLANPDWKGRVAFHPLCENITHGESQVLETYRKSIGLRLNYTIAVLALWLTKLPFEEYKLTPAQSAVLSKIKDIDQKTTSTLAKLLDNVPTNKSFVSLYLKKPGIVDGVSYARAGIVTFPLYEELCKDDNEVFGVKLRVKDKVGIKNLIEYLIPNVEIKGFYNVGSNSDIAPYADALVRTALKVIEPINEAVFLFKKHLKDANELLFDDTISEVFENLSKVMPEIRKVPMQPGNEGSVSKNKSSLMAPAIADNVNFKPTIKENQLPWNSPGAPALPEVAAPVAPAPQAVPFQQPAKPHVSQWAARPTVMSPAQQAAQQQFQAPITPSADGKISFAEMRARKPQLGMPPGQQIAPINQGQFQPQQFGRPQQQQWGVQQPQQHFIPPAPSYNSF